VREIAVILKSRRGKIIKKKSRMPVLGASCFRLNRNREGYSMKEFLIKLDLLKEHEIQVGG
jgi:hypothetical protein